MTSRTGSRTVRACLLSIVTALIVQGSLYPWYFDPARGSHNPLLVLAASWPSTFDVFALSDAIVNIVFYFPFGVACWLFLSGPRPRLALAALTLLAALLLSTGLELVQVYVPGRVCSLADVLCNFLGAGTGVLTAASRRAWFENLIARLTGWMELPSTPGVVFLLACWWAYQLFPLTPQVRLGSLGAEISFLIHPGAVLPAEVLTTLAEWFSVALLVSSIALKSPYQWLFGMLLFRFLSRPFLLTRIFALDELLGAALALCAWFLLSPQTRRPAALALLAAAIVLRQVGPFPLSRLPEYLGPGGMWLRSAFDYGAVVWTLSAAGASYVRAGLLVLVPLVAFAALRLALPVGHAGSLDPALVIVVTLILWLCSRHPLGLNGSEPTRAWS